MWYRLTSIKNIWLYVRYFLILLWSKMFTLVIGGWDIRKIAYKILGILLLLMSSFSSAAILIVPTEYSTIQEAINSASEGDTIFIQDGIYYENLQVGKVRLTGESRENTIINGSQQNSTIIITYKLL